MTDKVHIIPLGGLGEVGKNMMVIEHDRHMLIIDTGSMFPENDMLGVDLVIPDFGYLKDKKDQVDAIVLTHGHEDHIGALPYVLSEINAPIYATQLTQGLAEMKLQRRHISQAAFHTVSDGERVSIGPFDIEFFRVTHSIPDGVGLAIDTPVGTIVHSGDFKFDYTPVDGQPTDLRRLAGLGGRNVLALCADSTNAEHPGFTPSEQVVGQAFEDVFRHAKGRIIVGTFASLISRIQQVISVATRHERRVAIAGRTMVDSVAIAHRLGYIDIPSGALISLGESQHLPPEQVVILATGTQGEPSAALAKMASRRHRLIQVQQGDTVIMSAQAIPGNEEMVYRTINRLYQCGADVVYERIAPVHVSGHASQEEQKLLLHLVRPKFLVPIHGELRHLRAHARLAYEMGMPEENVLVVENGYVLEFTPNRAVIGERVPGGYVFVDGAGVGDVGPILLREREQLASDGFVVVVASLGQDRRLAIPPRIVTRGFVFEPQASELQAGIVERVTEVVARHADADDASLGKAMCQELEEYLYGEIGRRPIIIPIVNRPYLS
jgi:ribonuclease J